MRTSERVKPIWNSRKLWRNEKVNEPHNVRNSAGFGSWIQTCHWQMFVTSFAVILAKWLDHLTHILCFTCVAGYGSKSLRITSNHGHLKDHEMCLEDSHTHVRWAKVRFFFFGLLMCCNFKVVQPERNIQRQYTWCLCNFQCHSHDLHG